MRAFSLCFLVFAFVLLLDSSSAFHTKQKIHGYMLGRYGLGGHGAYDTAYYGRGYLPPSVFPPTTTVPPHRHRSPLPMDDKYKSSDN
ncbi:unnamed protein product [Leptosia nina]|uniref:Uncharacterized protein n=1 Tax=Leptosia nina TaxID=320188 RepID=A0AAV1JH89_9NEOP